jgi:dTDP-4-dehydrorhamnose 3,5-epimerase
MTSSSYCAPAARGVRYNEPVFGISWPIPIAVISDGDEKWPDYADD